MNFVEIAEHHVKDAVESFIHGVQRQIHRHHRKAAKGPTTQPASRKRMPGIVESDQERINHILKHIDHCLVQLCRQLAMVQAGWKCLTEDLWTQRIIPYFQRRAATPKDIAALLNHVFQQILRLHDGLILCVSGECRHPIDVRTAKKSPFPSCLAQDGLRGDGYTRLYSSQHTYSGMSWDEWNDESQGLKIRLFRAMKPYISSSKNIKTCDEWWDTLTDGPAMALEAVLSQLETKEQQLQDAFMSLTKRFRVQLEQVLLAHYSSVSVKLSLVDKMEHWKVIVDGTQCQIQRYANEFQLHESVLTTDWKTVMLRHPLLENCTDLKNTKRRRLIRDDEVDDTTPDDRATKLANARAIDNQPKMRQEKTSTANKGLSLRVVKPHKYVPDTSTDSVRELKAALGVNVETLESARAVLEAEEGMASEAANEVDCAVFSEADEDEALQDAQDKVWRLKRVLRHIINRHAPNDEVWDARECLRQATMDAGNRFLWCSKSRRERISQAVKLFVYARTLVLLQHKLLQEMVNESWTDETRLFHRNVFLLQGQAEMNIGIAKIELAREQGRTNYWNEAITDLEAALRCAMVIMDRCSEDERMVDNSHEILLDKLQAHELQMLARRWIGAALWYLDRWNEARVCFEQASSIPNDYLHISYSGDGEDILFQLSINLHVESYYSWVTLSDLASTVLEQASVSELRQNPKKYEEALDYALRALDKAAAISALIHRLVNEKWIHLSNDKGVIAEIELRDTRRDLHDWWKRKEKVLLDRIPTDNRSYSVSSLPRADIEVDPSYNVAPTRRMILKDERKRKNSNKTSVGGSFAGVPSVVEDRHHSVVSTSQWVYRKWGDELLPHQPDETGKSIPQLPAVSKSPVMPPEMTAVVARWKEEHQR